MYYSQFYIYFFRAPATCEEKEAPLSQEQTLNMLQAGIPSQQIEAFARKDGIDFKVTPELERDLRKAGATERLIQLLKKLEYRLLRRRLSGRVCRRGIRVIAKRPRRRWRGRILPKPSRR